MGVLVVDNTLDAAFPENIVPTLCDAVCTAWPEVGAFAPDAREDAISRKLVVKLRLRIRDSGLPVAVHSQVELLDPEEGHLVGKIDIIISTGSDEAIYFSFECKRLNVCYPSGFRSDAGEYCDDGMMRYITGQYAPGLGRGGMIGYVMDGRCAAAMQAVSKAIGNRRQRLRLQHNAPLLVSSVQKQNRSARDSRHKTVANRDFTIHHLLLAVAGTRPAG